MNWPTQKLGEILMTGINFIKAYSLSIIWFIFTGLFFYMAIREFIRSKKGLPVKEINLGFPDMNEAYEITRKTIIEADKSSHRTAAISYFLAGLVSLLSLVVPLL